MLGRDAGSQVSGLQVGLLFSLLQLRALCGCVVFVVPAQAGFPFWFSLKKTQQRTQGQPQTKGSLDAPNLENPPSLLGAPGAHPDGSDFPPRAAERGADAGAAGAAGGRPREDLGVVADAGGADPTRQAPGRLQATG